jgi:hypothetical protein
VSHDQRQRVLVLRLDVDEVDLHAVDLGRELRQPVEPRLDPPEVVLGRPVASQLFHRRELDALRAIVDELLARPTCRGDAAAEVFDLLVRHFHLEGSDVRRAFGGGAAHGDSFE